MSLWYRWQRLREQGILGMNHRNTECILDLNPRRYFPLVDSKQKMHRLCREIGVGTPEIYGIIRRHSEMRHLSRILEDHADFVIKPDRGAGGRGILVVMGREGAYFLRHNGQRLELSDIRQQVSSIISGMYSLGGQSDEALIQQRVLPDPAFEQVSYQGVGDIRVVLYKKAPVMAMLRLPTRMSGGRANLHQGGIGAGVDLDTGVTNHAVLRNRMTDCHPDTAASVVGFRVPCWQEIIAMACRVSPAVGLGYLGVDIVLDRHQGPLLLEVNARPGLAIQIANGMGLLPKLRRVDQSLGDGSSGSDPINSLPTEGRP
jgi:alpha-L-glutamate ligase-like protein